MPDVGKKQVGVMVWKGLAAASAAVALAMVIPGPAEAYPTTTRTSSGTSTVTGTYRPVDFEFEVLPVFKPEGPAPQESALTISAPTTIPFVGDLYGISLTLFLQGSWEGVGYATSVNPEPKGDDAGTWKLSLDLIGVLDGSTMSAYALDNWPVGSLDLILAPENKFASSTNTSLSLNDTPHQDDRFLIYTRPDCASDRLNFLACQVLQLDLEALDPTDSFQSFDATLFEALTHVGPFVPCTGGSTLSPYSCNYYYNAWWEVSPAFPFVSPLFRNPLVEDYRLDGGASGRTSGWPDKECRPGSPACSTGERGISAPVGGFASTDVPLPGTLALFGIGLLGLGLRRRGPARRSDRS